MEDGRVKVTGWVFFFFFQENVFLRVCEPVSGREF
jgi:hypothetical protein